MGSARPDCGNPRLRLPWLAVLLFGLAAIPMPAQVTGETNRVQQPLTHAFPGRVTTSSRDAVPLTHAMDGFLSLAATNVSFNPMAPVNRAAKDPWDGENFTPSAITNLLWATDSSNPSATTVLERTRVLQQHVMPGLIRGSARRSVVN